MQKILRIPAVIPGRHYRHACNDGKSLVLSPLHSPSLCMAEGAHQSLCTNTEIASPIKGVPGYQNLAVSVILRCVPRVPRGYHTWLFWSYSGYVPRYPQST